MIAGSGVRVLRLLERVQEARRHLRLCGAARARGQREGQHAPLRPGPMMTSLQARGFKQGCGRYL